MATAAGSQRPVTVLHFMWAGGMGGAERAVYQLVREQALDPELEPSVALSRDNPTYRAELAACGVPVIDLKMRSGADLASAIRAVPLISGYDVHHFHAPEVVWFVSSILSGRRVRVFTRRGGTWDGVQYLRRRMRLQMAGFALRHFWTGYSGNTRHAANVAVAEFRLRGEEVAVTYNGTDFSLLAPRRAPEAVRADLGIPDDAVVIGSSGKLRAIKRNDLLVRVARDLHDRGVYVLLVGDGRERERLEQLAEGLGVGDRLVITGVTNDVATYLRAMDVFVMGSNDVESFANAMVEAMALGVPAIACADSPGPCEHIRDGETGFIARDPAHLTQLVSLLADDPALRNEVGARGSDAVRTRYTPQASAAAYRALYARAGARL